MIRGLFLLLGLSLGVIAAGLSQTEIAHLRVLMPGRLAAWTTGLDPESGLLRGTGVGLPDGSTVKWRLLGLDAGGARYRIELVGSGFEFRGELHARIGNRMARIKGPITGLAPKQWLPALQEVPDIDGARMLDHRIDLATLDLSR